jgi:rfaE bifunctional protein nucleotidyltransferase chain/domain
MQHLDLIKSKVLELPELKRQLTTWRFFHQKIVFTNGCFDLLHLGHIDYLLQAKKLGDKLLIGLNTDESVKQIKGEQRPITNQNSRSLILASLSFVDGVILFSEATPVNLILEIRPDVLVKGSDYQVNEIVGSDIVKENGGEIVTINFLEGYSTSAIISKIKKY